MRTVLGDVAASALGHVQPHEHILCDLSLAPGRWDIEGQLVDTSIAAAEVAAFHSSPGDTLVDMTTSDFGRCPTGLAEIAQRTGVQIVMGCGWYRQPYYPPLIDHTISADLAAALIDEIENGVGDSGVRPGVIGEIGSDKVRVTAQEERVFRAAAMAHAVTGLGVMTHTPMGAAPIHLDLLEQSGADLRRVAVGHADLSMSIDYHLAILERGAFASFDLIGQSAYPDRWRAQHLMELIQLGYVDQLLLSLDLCHRSRLSAWGGSGYDALRTDFLPILIEAGASEEQIEIMTRSNPVRFLDVA